MAYRMMLTQLCVSICVTQKATASVWGKSVSFYWPYKTCVTHTRSSHRTDHSIPITNGYETVYVSGYGSIHYWHTTLFTLNFHTVWLSSLRNILRTRSIRTMGR